MLHPPELLARFRSNPEIRRRAEQRALPWRDFDLDDLWRLVFGPRITRSWMVWSDGDCPACGCSVNMYGWVTEPFAEPWKLHCPHCEERFPKNDFAAFHESGLDEVGLFDPSRADRDLLFNVEHPDPGDPLRDFGVDDGFLPRMLARHERLVDHWRFHIDAWVGQRFYPNVGDSGSLGRPGSGYAGATFDRENSDPLAPSAFSFFWQFYEASGDPAFVQVLHHANDGTVDDLPHDAGHPDPADFQRRVQAVIDAEGTRPTVGCVNKSKWCLAILRSGDDRRAPTAWLDYDSGAPDSIYSYRLDPTVRGRGAHSHADGMNLGLYFRGVDLMTDRGYPPVNYGGWASRTAEWYKRTSAHNTVVVDGLDQATAAGEVHWWHDSKQVCGLCASAPGMVDGGRFERTIVLVATGPEDAYLVDVHRVRAGMDHARFLHATFGALATDGLTLENAEDYGHESLMRNFRLDPAPAEGWVADWTIDDVHGLGPAGTELHLRYTDMTRGAGAGTCEGFALCGYYGEREERWLSTVVQRRRAETEPLTSVFAGVLEPYEDRPAVAEVRRIDDVAGDAIDGVIELEIGLVDGRCDRLQVGLGDRVQVERDGERLA